MGGRTSATGGGSSSRLSAVGDLACMCEHEDGQNHLVNTDRGRVVLFPGSPPP